MTDEQYMQMLHEVLPLARGMTPEEMLESQVSLMIAQQKAYVENKELFDRLWAEAIQNHPITQNSWDQRFKNWYAVAGPWNDE